VNVRHAHRTLAALKMLGSFNPLTNSGDRIRLFQDFSGQ
jgi:hypothetical protein